MAIPLAGRGLEVAGVYALFTTLTSLTMVLRIYCRVCLVKKFGWDDWTAAVAWAIFIAHAACAFSGVQHGTGQHAWDIQPPTEIPIGLMWWWMCEPTYVLSNMAIKLSIAIMLLRLTIDCTHRLIIIITIVVTEVYSTVFFFLFVFQCRPSSYFWTQFTGGSGSCMNPQITVNASYAYSAVTCLSDWIFAILPWFLVWNLQMPQRQKSLIAVILSLGAIASTATIIRIPYIHTLNNKADFLYATTDVAIWSCSETGLGITAANAVTLRPLIRSWLHASTSFRSNAARSIARRSSTRASRRDGAGGEDGRPVSFAIGKHDEGITLKKLNISSPTPVPRASFAGSRGCWRGSRWAKRDGQQGNDNIEAAPAAAFRDHEIRKTTDVVMVGASNPREDTQEHEFDDVDLAMDRERWRSISEDSQGSEAKMAPAPPVPPKSRRDRARERELDRARAASAVGGVARAASTSHKGGGPAGGAVSHCRCNCRALEFEQVRSLLDGRWIGAMVAGPSGERRKGDGKG